MTTTPIVSHLLTRHPSCSDANPGPARAQLGAAAARTQTSRPRTAASSRPAAAAPAAGTDTYQNQHTIPTDLLSKQLPAACNNQGSASAQGICSHLEAHARLLRLLHDIERPAAWLRSALRHRRQSQVHIAAVYQNVRLSCTMQTCRVWSQQAGWSGEPDEASSTPSMMQSCCHMLHCCAAHRTQPPEEQVAGGGVARPLQGLPVKHRSCAEGHHSTAALPAPGSRCRPQLSRAKMPWSSLAAK
jgi:hypothetical protein